MWTLFFIMIFWVIPAIINFVAELICLVLRWILDLIENKKSKKNSYK